MGRALTGREWASGLLNLSGVKQNGLRGKTVVALAFSPSF